MIALSSCYNTQILVGNVTQQEPVVKVKKVWNHHAIGGLVPIGATMTANAYVGDTPNYVIKTNLSFLNGLISGITMGIYTPSQTTYYVPLRDAGAR
ncbi:MAG: Bor family protein [Culturomica sp.]|jgi:hypothetical protein|nr:Bor family protein [Culturomica sp.]